DPQATFQNHIAVNGPPMDSHLFTYRHKGGHCPLTKLKFTTPLSSTAKKAGIKPLQGHGIHISSTLKYLLHNVNFNITKIKGWWASDTFLIYLCHHTQILLLVVISHSVHILHFILFIQH
ncbi:hypothetical protein PAXRUDRAFT_162964, partial [Paxillus rubicundulus Ve08.2h10]